MSFNADLVEDLARQKVILFLGAGVSASAITHSGNRFKGWAAFLNDMCARAEEPAQSQAISLINQKDYLLACEILQNALADDWERLVSTEFGQAAEPSKLHAAIVSLDQRIVVTTNFDKLIETSWVTKLGNSTHLPTVIAQLDDSMFKLLKDHSGKYIVKIHGTVDRADTLVFSRSEYIRMAFGNPIYASFLEMLLVNYTFLFIGFSMDDPAITSLMELYTLRYPKSRPHYIISPKGRDQAILDLNKKLRKLVTISYDDRDFHAQLPQLVEQLAEEMNMKRKELAASTL